MAFMKSEATYLVNVFHTAFDLPVSYTPELIPPDRAELRYELIREELSELREALDEGDLLAVADALTDLEYVVRGAALEFGIDLDACLREVHRSNMTKLGADGKPVLREADGKVLKGPSYEPPDLAGVLGL